MMVLQGHVGSDAFEITFWCCAVCNSPACIGSRNQTLRVSMASSCNHTGKVACRMGAQVHNNNKNHDKNIYKGRSALVNHLQVGSHQSKGGRLGAGKKRNSTNMSDGVYLFGFELLEAVLPVLGKLGLLALARLDQRRFDLHLPLATPARQAQTGSVGRTRRRRILERRKRRKKKTKREEEEDGA